MHHHSWPYSLSLCALTLKPDHRKQMETAETRAERLAAEAELAAAAAEEEGEDGY